MKNIIFGTILCVITFCTNIKAQTDFYDINSIRELRLYFSQPNWDYLLDSLFIAGQEERLLARITIDGNIFDSVGVRYKGYSSVDTARVKNPLNIELDYIIEGQEYKGVSKLKLSNVLHDPSFIREVLSYEIARKYMPASKANYANVYVNDTLLGLYSNIEAVNKDFTETRFGSRINSFFKGNPAILTYPQGSNSNLQYYSNDTTAYYPYYSIESDFGWTNLLKLTNTLNNEPVDSFENILNIDGALWMLAFDYSLVNLDSYIGYSQNYYLYMDDHHRFNPILWDLNMSFASFRLSDGGNSAYTGGITINQAKNLNPLGLVSTSISPRPLIKKILVVPMWKKMFLAHMRTIINENFVTGEYYTRGQQLQSIIDTCVKNDFNKFYSYSDFQKNIDTTVGGSGGMIQYPGIKNLMEGRIAYLNNYSGFLGQPVITNISNSPIGTGTEIWITAKITNADTCILAYRYMTSDLFTKVPMFDDGNHQDGVANDSIYGTSVLTGNVVQFYIYAQNSTSGIFSPERAEYEYHLIQNTNPPNIVINEFMADNNSFIPDQNNGYDDWIELYNNSSNKINMSGMYLSDDISNLNKWAFPDTSILAHNYLIIWADNQTTQKGLHSNFKLSSSGEAVYLCFSGNNIIDSVSFGQQKTDTTTGRYPNGIGHFWYMRPSFSATNWPSSVMTVLWNDSILVYPNPADTWIELSASNVNDKKFTVEIINESGLVLYRENLIYSNTKEAKKRIDVSKYSSGLYLLRFISESSITNKKLVIY